MEPQGELDLMDTLRGTSRLVQPGETFIEMLHRVIVAMRLAVAGYDVSEATIVGVANAKA
jgi:hypothetical protein